MNGAYVYPSAEYAHELLSAGAWLGTVLTGRAALMPMGIAEAIVDYVASVTPQPDRTDQRVQRIMQCYAGLIGGRRRLLVTAKKTLTKGPQIFRPSHRAKAADVFERQLWEPELLKNVQNFLAGLDTKRDGLRGNF
jgi:hypothetical protein